MRSLSKVWVSDLGNGSYKNPVLYSDYSDPDAIRVGNDFYMVASSFCNTPALPVLHSKDLVNWEVINYVLDKIPYPDYDVPAHGRGVWAPAIRYHDNKFWVFYPMPDEGIFMCTATDPCGKWSEPVAVREGKGWIDPCPFWDDDGRAYLVNAFAGSRIGFKSILHISEMKPDGTGLVNEGKNVFDGHATQPTIEGPKLYKRNGYYYIFAPAGGVPTGWQTVLRSKNIWGPYDEKIVMRQGDTPINGPHQGAWIELENGEDWFIHFQDANASGRIVHLQPMRWENDWPIIGEGNDGQGAGQPVLVYRKPNVGKAYPVTTPVESDEFDAPKLGLQWQWNANYRSDWYSLEPEKSHIRLFAKPQADLLCNAPSLLLQKFTAPDFQVTAKLDTVGLTNSDSSGLMIFGGVYSSIAIEKEKDGLHLVQIEGRLPKEGGGQKQTELQEIACNGMVWLRATVTEGKKVQFFYSADGNRFAPCGEPFETNKGHWVGAKMGIYCLSENADSAGFADADWFRVEEIGK